jgi:hypothetical protein
MLLRLKQQFDEETVTQALKTTEQDFAAVTTLSE